MMPITNNQFFAKQKISCIKFSLSAITSKTVFGMYFVFAAILSYKIIFVELDLDFSALIVSLYLFAITLLIYPFSILIGKANLYKQKHLELCKKKKT